VTLPAGDIWCELLSGKPVALWSKTPFAQTVMVWHVEHAEALVGKLAATWLGTLPPKVVVLVQADWWHPMQSAELSV
jgi:hypothetical protein